MGLPESDNTRKVKAVSIYWS